MIYREAIPEGFTFEFIFHKPIRVLLIDDGRDGNNKRIDKAKKKYNKNEEKFKHFFHSKEHVTNLSELDDYNLVFLHSSNHNNEQIRKYLEDKDFHYIAFSGGEMVDRKVRTNYCSLTDATFYQHLENYLLEIKEKAILSFDFWESVIIPQNEQFDINIEDLIRRFQDKRIDEKELSKNIFKITGKEVNISQFKPIQLMEFIQKNKLK